MGNIKIHLNPDRCVCCYACVIACQDLHYDVDEEGPALRRALRQETETGEIRCTSMGCMHCANAPCLTACPTGAIWRDEDTGLVQVNQERCVGCRSCLKACPFQVPQFNARNKMVKCDGCLERIRAGRLPVCVQCCPSGALTLLQQ